MANATRKLSRFITAVRSIRIEWHGKPYIDWLWINHRTYGMCFLGPFIIDWSYQ